ncbi:MAG: molybdopterin-dependent oxidoreductase [Actinomycetota bacterium]
MSDLRQAVDDGETGDRRSGSSPLARTWERLEPLRIGPLKEGAFTSKLHTERTAAQLGLALGVGFAVCFVTGLISHGIQSPPAWFLWPSRPFNLYRITQGLHVATGLATIPLLLAKLWTVFPKLFTWPPVENAAHGLERLSLLPLVGGSVFLLMSGLNNIALWYPWRFFFPAAHFWAAWITIGALIVHIGAKATITRAALRRPKPSEITPAPEGALSRRAFLGAVAASAAVVTVATVGETFGPLRGISVLAPRDPAIGPQGFPVNKTARSAGVTSSAIDPAWRLRVDGKVRRALSLSLSDLKAMEQRVINLPIACVEGWSATATWEGVPVRALLAMAGAREDAEVGAESIQKRGLYRRSELNRLHAADPDTLIALRVNGEPLHIEHGFPARLIGPNRPGVMQTKWLGRLRVL